LSANVDDGLSCARLLGRHRFDEFQQGTGIARNILSSRLRDLVEKASSIGHALTAIRGASSTG